VFALTTVLNSCGHETSGWPQLYNNDSDFATAYQTLSAGKTVPNFHLKDGLLCHLSHLCVPSSECAKLIWEAHYSRTAGHFGVEKTMAVLQKHFYWPEASTRCCKYIRSCTSCAIAKPTPLFLLRIGLGSPSPWTTCLVCLQPSMGMTVSSWSLIDSLRWKFWHPARRASQPRPPPSSSSHMFGFILGYHKLLSMIEIVGS
jgi:hypothetical protein